MEKYNLNVIVDLYEFIDTVKDTKGKIYSVFAYGKIEEVEWLIENVVKRVVVTQILDLHDYCEGGEGKPIKRMFNSDNLPEMFKFLIHSSK